ncbi:hypothetical protein DEG00_012560, partial [Xanthomonas vasicola]
MQRAQRPTQFLACTHLSVPGCAPLNSAISLQQPSGQAFALGQGAPKDGLINATGKRSNRIRRAEGAQIADFLPVSARLRGVAWITG